MNETQILQSSEAMLFDEAIRIQAASIQGLLSKIPAQLNQLCEVILSSSAKLIVTGMGKSGIIGQKIAATLSSTGTPSFFVHPADAYHGDLGMISGTDIVLAISNSGETEEILRLISYLKRNGNYLIAMTGNIRSTLARHADFHFDVGVVKEACPYQLVPTSSTTASLVVGDALALVLMTLRGFKPADFAVFHPGGALGRRLLTTVEMIMKSDGLPLVREDDSVIEVVTAISSGRCGLAIVRNQRALLSGVITDGDIRRAMEYRRETFFSLNARDIMTSSPKTVQRGTRLVDAEEIMAQHKINSLLVLDGEKVEGIVQIFDI